MWAKLVTQFWWTKEAGLLLITQVNEIMITTEKYDYLINFLR